MKQEYKELLLKDLCGRLPYGVKVDVSYSKGCASSLRSKICSEGVSKMGTLIFWLFQEGEVHLKPYLFPLSRMTEEQKEELDKITYGSVSIDKNFFYDLCNCSKIDTYCIIDIIDWLNRNHIDYRGLIPVGLAIDATNLNVYSKEE